MEKLKGICITNEVNLYKHKYAEESLVNNYYKLWNIPTPAFANHNHTKAIGYMLLDGIYFEPDFMCLLNSTYIPLTEKENTHVKKFCYDYLYKERVLENKEDYDSLKEKLKGNIVGKVYEYYVNGAFIYNKDIVKRVFPKLFSQVNDDGLVDINILEPLLPGIYKMGEFVVYAHKFFRRGYSYLNTLNTPFLERIENLKKSSCKIQIAIDLDCIGLASAIHKEYEYSYWGGPKFSDKIEEINLGVTCFNNDNYDGLMSEVRRTEMGWYIQDDIKTFECEELIDIPNIRFEDGDFYGCRYVHSMVDKETYTPIHLDGAIRAYDDEKMIERLDVRMNKAKRNTRYTKIWRIDGEIQIDKWKELISHYYRDNTLIGEYFGGVDENLPTVKEKNNENDEISLKRCIPDNLTVDSGIKCYIHYSKPEKLETSRDIRIIPTTTITIQNQTTTTIESIILTFIKILRNKGLNVLIPNAQIIQYEDLVVNFPTFFCKNVEVANVVVECIKELVCAWKSNNDDRIITFSLKIPYELRSMTISFAGHVNNFHKFFCSPKYEKFVQSDNDIDEWIIKMYNTFTELFNRSKDQNPFSLIKSNNIIVVDRKMLDPNLVQGISTKDKGILAQLRMPPKEARFIKRENIKVAVFCSDLKLICSKCGNDYSKCNCILHKDSEVVIAAESYKPLGYFWTNRKS